MVADGNEYRANWYFHLSTVIFPTMVLNQMRQVTPQSVSGEEAIRSHFIGNRGGYEDAGTNQRLASAFATAGITPVN